MILLPLLLGAAAQLAAELAGDLIEQLVGAVACGRIDGEQAALRRDDGALDVPDRRFRWWPLDAGDAREPGLQALDRLCGFGRLAQEARMRDAGLALHEGKQRL